MTAPSLYERLGGVHSIATVIDDFIDRIMVDPRFNLGEGLRGLLARDRRLHLWLPACDNGNDAQGLHQCGQAGRNACADGPAH